MDIKHTLERLVSETRNGSLNWDTKVPGIWSVALCSGVLVVVGKSGDIVINVGDINHYSGTDYAEELKNSGLIEELQNRFKYAGSLQQGLDAINKCLDA